MKSNYFYTCDNLFLLNGMNSESIDLIYLDPPFNSKRNYSARIGSKAAGANFKDIWTWDDVNEAYLERLYTKHPDLTDFINVLNLMHSKPMQAYITYMAQRVLEMHRVLKKTGSLFLHCDPTASHYLKIIADNIFGQNNFRNEIIWKRRTEKHNRAQKHMGRIHDVILYYVKSEEAKYNKQYQPYQQQYIDSHYKHQDETGYYSTFPCTNETGGNKPYAFKGMVRAWRFSPETMQQKYDAGLLVQPNPDSPFRYKKYLHEAEGVPLQDLWDDVDAVRGKKSSGYPTEKPLELLHRVIKAGSSVGDVIFDPFCGCATACVAAQQLQRHWIGCDIEENSVNILMQRLSDDAGMFKDFVHTTTPPVRQDVEIAQPSMPIKNRLYKMQNNKCNGCQNEYLLKDFEVDHIIPRSKGGGDYYENYQLLCGNCNRVKGNKPMDYLLAKVQKIKDNRINVSYQ